MRCQRTVDARGEFDTPQLCDRPMPCPVHRMSRYGLLVRELGEICHGVDVQTWPVRGGIRLETWIAPQDLTRVGWLLIEMARVHEAEAGDT